MATLPEEGACQPAGHGRSQRRSREGRALRRVLSSVAATVAVSSLNAAPTLLSLSF